ncbi:recombinase family protein [Verrucomicrobia bacterium]|nr:recombinase family protein [Verrucomicrobiota bacterium]
MSEIVAYARVSTREQNLDVQLDQLNAAGATKIFKEKLSGVDQQRPELKNLLNYVREGDTVVVTKIDRIARSVKHLLDITDTLKEKGVALKIMNMGLETNTTQGKLMLTVIGAIAEFERELMLERQREGIEKAKQKGKYKGRKPTAKAKSEQVMKMLDNGYKKTQIAEELDIGLASVYRIIADQQKTA